jgi:hypothetical protein
MPCLGVLIALMAPRFLIVLLWLFTGWFKGIFATALWPVLGFIFLPTTLLWYTAVQNWWNGHWGLLQIIGIVIAIFVDLKPFRRKRRRTVHVEPDEHPDLGRQIN